MHLRQVNSRTIRQIKDRELLNLHFRLHQLFPPLASPKDPQEQARRLFYISRHQLIAHEMIRRGLRFRAHDQLDSIAPPEIETFIESFSSLIPTRLGNLSGKELIRLHNQLHSIWSIVRHTSTSSVQQEQLWNWHKLVMREIESRGLSHPLENDELDQALIVAARTFPSGASMGDWITLSDFLVEVPEEVVIIDDFALIDAEAGGIYISDSGGQQLIKVAFFRILRQFPRPEWLHYRAVPETDLGSIDVVYSLVLRRIDPFWVVQLSLGFDDLCLVKPYLYIVGGLVTQGATKNDIDVLLRFGLSEHLENRIFNKFSQHFPEPIRKRMSLLKDAGLSPYTSYLGLCSLDLVRRDVSEVELFK